MRCSVPDFEHGPRKWAGSGSWEAEKRHPLPEPPKTNERAGSVQ